MIITRTPFRVSLLGGGTDFPVWYRRHGGLVVGGAVDRYCYIHARELPPYHDYKTRVVYSAIEAVADNADIQHRAVNACVREVCPSAALEVFHAADLPGRSGIGSSSSFVVGLLNALHALHGARPYPDELALAATRIEQDVLGETVGCQDQRFAAHGGLNVIRFRPSGEVSVLPLNLSDRAVADLEEHLLLFFTGESRTSSDVARTYAPSLGERDREQWAMVRLAEDGIEAVLRGRYEALGGLIDQSWRIKSGLAPGVDTATSSRLYSAARLCGAWGGKLTGAGGGGCMLLVCPPEKRKGVVEAMRAGGAVHIPFRFEYDGSVVVFRDRRRGAA